jgi:hypothetical protein
MNSRGSFLAIFCLFSGGERQNLSYSTAFAWSNKPVADEGRIA